MDIGDILFFNNCFTSTTAITRAFELVEFCRSSGSVAYLSETYCSVPILAKFPNAALTLAKVLNRAVVLLRLSLPVPELWLRIQSPGDIIEQSNTRLYVTVTIAASRLIYSSVPNLLN